jgi:hypothetical protein
LKKILGCLLSPNFLTFAQESTPRNQFRQSLCGLAGRYDNPITETFLKFAMEQQAEVSFLDFSQIVQNY